MSEMQTASPSGPATPAGALFIGTKEQLKQQVEYLARIDTADVGTEWGYVNWRGHWLWRRLTNRGGR